LAFFLGLILTGVALAAAGLVGAVREAERLPERFR